MISRLEALERMVVGVGESLRSLSGRVAALGNQLWQVQAGMQSTFVVPLEYRYAKAPGGGISARSGTTLGSGTVTFYTRSGATLTLGSTTATAYNPSTTAVGANKVIIVIGREGGPWDVVVESCD